MKKVISFLKGKWALVVTGFYFLAACQATYAYIIPISQTDQTQSGSDVIETGQSVLQKEVLPFFMLGAAAILCGIALFGIIKGYRQYQSDKEAGPFITSLFMSLLLIVVGGLIFYILFSLRTYKFN